MSAVLCEGCRRPLSDAESRRLRWGPKCRRNARPASRPGDSPRTPGVAVPRRPARRARTRTRGPIPGQLDLTELETS